MPGSASVIGRIKLIQQPNTSAPNATVAQAAFGAQTDGGGAPSGRALLHPARPFGLRVWLGVGSIVFLWWVYYHLPE